MIITFSEKHASGNYGENVKDNLISDECINKCKTKYWDDYFTIHITCELKWYVHISTNNIYPLEPESFYISTDFLSGTIISFTQDSLS